MLAASSITMCPFVGRRVLIWPTTVTSDWDGKSKRFRSSDTEEFDRGTTTPFAITRIVGLRQSIHFRIRSAQSRESVMIAFENVRVHWCTTYQSHDGAQAST